MLKVLDVFRIGNNLSVTLEGSCAELKNGSVLLGRGGKRYEVISVAMVKSDEPTDFSKTTTVLMPLCDIKKGLELKNRLIYNRLLRQAVFLSQKLNNIAQKAHFLNMTLKGSFFMLNFLFSCGDINSGIRLLSTSRNSSSLTASSWVRSPKTLRLRFCGILICMIILISLQELR